MLTPTRLDARFAAYSPRLNRPPFTIASILLHGGALVLLAVLVDMAWRQTGIFAWSVGIAYIGYDTFLLGFVAVMTWSLHRQQVSPAPPRADRTETLAVLLAAHNEQAVLVATIKALAAQAEAPDIILIADNGSTDTTPTVLAEAFGLAPAPYGDIATSPVMPSLCWLRVE